MVYLCDMNFRKALGVTAVVFALILSSCSSSSEEAAIDTGILSRLNISTGFGWEVQPLTEIASEDKEVYKSEGYIEQLWPSDLGKCLAGVSIWENAEFAKSVKAQFFEGPPWDGTAGVVWQFEDPETKYGIILIDYGDPCSVAAASTFDFDLPTKN
jgi:hypothetical protein